MLIFGDYTCIPSPEIVHSFAGRQFTMFNLSSYVQSCFQLSNLLPKGVDCSSDENLDMSYFDYIYGNQYAFMDFMFIINELYKGSIVYLIINHTDFYDKLAESLSEIIKQRYGYLSYFVNDMDDYESILYNIDSGTFSIIGLSNFDNDRKKFLSIAYTNGLIKDEDTENYD